MPRKSSKSKRRSLFWQITLFGFLSLFVFGLFVFIFFARDLPRPERFGELQTTRPTEIYDRTGEVLLFEIFGEEKRSIIAIEDMPEHVLNAIITAEDASFWRHIGIDPKGIIRSILANIRTGTRGQGGSTISQQLIRSSLLTTKKTVARKVKEIILTLELERQYSKEDILEFYLNQVPLGSNCLLYTS
ncbi:MAG TPA: peptidase, partial [candidate division CPR3 bacterium]|nr:peptidase [candidate division CPR3 bacterium]